MGFGVRGASHSEVDKFQAAQAAELKRLKGLLPQGMRVVRFPGELKQWQVWQDRPGRAPVSVSGAHHTPEAAIREVLR